MPTIRFDTAKSHEPLPRISVVTPSFNQARFLRATLESIHGQGYADLEHIVMDGGSTDGSVGILREFDSRISYWESAPDDGQTDALIRGFERATGEIQCWLNSDDLFEPNTLAEVGAYFRDHPDVDFLYGDATWIDVEGRVIKSQREHGFNQFIWRWGHNYLPQPSVFWRSRLYEAVGGLDRGFDLAMDADLWARFMERTRPVHVGRPWSRMRFYPEQKNTRLRAESEAEVARIRARYRAGGRTAAIALPPLAKLLRVSWKLATMRYGSREIAENLLALTGRGNWEQRRVASTGGDQ